MIRRLLASRKKLRKEKNYEAVEPIYKRGASLLPPEYLTVHQESEPARLEKINAAAEERRQQRNARRLAQRNGATR